MTTGTISYREELNAVFMTFTNNLAPGLYRASLVPPLADLGGNALARPFIWTFWIVPELDSDGDGLPDAVEVLLGLDPNNSDTGGTGIPDGSKDFDHDGLSNAAEVLLGTDPTNEDTNGNGVKDGDEDLDDHDGLKNSQEIALGTNPRLADSDGDGWNDEVELTAGSNPFDRLSTPRLTVVAQPPLRVTVPGVGSADGLPFGTVVTLPPVKVTAPAVGSTDGLPFNTFIAQPPVEVRIE